MKLTDRTIAALTLPKGKSELIVFDDTLPGFGLRLRAGGSRWIYQYKLGVQHRRITIGVSPAVSAARARETATELHAKVRLGQDPAGDKAEGQLRVGETVAAALQSYLAEKRAAVKPSSYRGVERHLLKHCKPLHNLQLGKIDRRTVATRIAAIAAKSGPVEGNRVRASLQAFFNWCIRTGVAESNPVVGTGRKPERSRERVLSDAELRAIWNATADDSDYSAIVRLLMLTGQRADEIASLRWSEVELDAARIILPAERTKNSRAHIVHLAEPARAILSARQHTDGFVFGRHTDRPFTGWSRCKMALGARLRDSGAPFDWVHHDLRRSMATRMAELDTAPHIIEAVLNHVSGHKHGVAGVYNRAGYAPQQAHALDVWAEHLLGIVEDRAAATRVVKLRRRS